MSVGFEEKRRAPRIPARLDAVVAVGRSPLFRCLILDINIYGCRLHVGDEEAPERFHLIDLPLGVAYEARVIWRKAPLLGTRFLATWNLAAPESPEWLEGVRGETMRVDAAKRDIKLVWSAG